MSTKRRFCLPTWRFATALGLLFSTLVSGSAAFAAEANENRADLVVDDPRPVAKAIDVLISRYGYWITYEDSSYAYEGDIVDVATEVRKDLSTVARGQAPTTLVPLGGRLELNYGVAPRTRQSGTAVVNGSNKPQY